LKIHRPTVVIAGFGDTGLLTAAHLDKRFNIVGLSPKPCLVSGQELGNRLARPTLWQRDYLLPYARCKALDGVTILHGTAQNIDAASSVLSWRDADDQTHRLPYDVLVIASGVRNGFWRDASVQSEAEVRADLQIRAERIRSARRIAIVGGGPSAVSVASNVRQVHPDTRVDVFFSRERILPGYHERTRERVTRQLESQGVILHPQHRAEPPTEFTRQNLSAGTIRFISGQPEHEADCILWAIGQGAPNNAFIPPEWLTDEGFVRVDPYLRVPGARNVYAIGDIAATDPLRCSARNAGFVTLARNIEREWRARTDGSDPTAAGLKAFRPASHRWGSILGIQDDGLRIFSPGGRPFRVSPWWVEHLLFPLFVRRMIYRGVRERRE
jgi:apoptosis-inducing factor 2